MGTKEKKKCVAEMKKEKTKNHQTNWKISYAKKKNNEGKCVGSKNTKNKP